ncbi:Hsp20/alpha crystallin family protein [Zobellella maritima]|uniref:Hsp20/alpha crystallin family protein n=1 Tax=Zobellella maritima TaxID=2059725 RepID=UPI001300989C|nr:Hsp20/alpha crystallin family protein [Zobellella maritima]
MAIKRLSSSRLAPWNWFKHEQDEPLTMVGNEQELHPLARLQQDMERLFERNLRRFGSDLPLGDWPAFSQLKPSIDISEREGCYLISVEIPGVKKEDVTLTQEGDRLVIRGEKKHEHEEKSDTLHRIERSYGHFQRVLTLPADARTEDISAQFKDGVLKVEVPRQANAEHASKQINIIQQ